LSLQKIAVAIKATMAKNCIPSNTKKKKQELS